MQDLVHHRAPRITTGDSPHLYTHSSRVRTRELGGIGMADEDVGEDVEQHYQHLPPPTAHHHQSHHHISDHPPPNKMARTGRDLDGGIGSVSPGLSMNSSGGPNSGGAGLGVIINSPQQHHQQMPSPAARPRGPKLKFTQDDDTLLVDLKENKQLTWKQIAEYFPGRSSGTLQVRYCTKLKAKTTNWSEESVQKLRNALMDYENERWRIVAQKVGHGFSAAACKEKAREEGFVDIVDPPPSQEDPAVSAAAAAAAVVAGVQVLAPPPQQIGHHHHLPHPHPHHHHHLHQQQQP